MSSVFFSCLDNLPKMNPTLFSRKGEQNYVRESNRNCSRRASVAIHKCCQNSEVFSEIMIASRTLSKCDALKEKLAPTTKTIITTAKVDADCTEELIALIKQYQPDAVLNLADTV